MNLILSEPGSKLAVGGILGHSASAAGKEAFMRVLAAELAPRSVRVVGIRPHAVVDAPAAGSYTTAPFDPAALAAGQTIQQYFEDGGMAQGTILKRLPTLSEVAEDAVFIASDLAGSMTGTVINLSAGALVD